MKTKFFLFLTFFFYLFSIKAQNLRKCSTDENVKLILNPNLESINSGPFIFKLYIFKVGPSDCPVGQTISDSDVTNALNNLQSCFGSLDINFTVACIDEICDDIYYQDSELLFTSPYMQNDGINLFLNNSLGGNAQIGGNAMHSSVSKADICHEMGHVLGLYHTFRGSPYSNSNDPVDNHTAELVNGSNCTYAGDEICDTPADPGALSVQLQNCSWPPAPHYTSNGDLIVDANGQIYSDVDVKNYMSYYSDNCVDHFTNGQYQRMSNVISSSPKLINARNDDAIIYGDVIWTTPKVIDTDIFIKNGGKLTIQTTVSMAPGKKIILEGESKLYVDNGVLTNGGGSCDGSTNEKWGGIQLLNNFNSYSTNPPLLKGTLPHVNFSNGSVMENSQSGIFALANTTDFRGSIWSNDSYFIDNEKSISFFNSSRSPYFNLIFNNTEFLIQDNFEGKFKGFVSLIAANQTTFFDCRFEIKNNQFSNFGTTVGISSFFSDLIVKASSKENGYFKSLRSGIYLYNGAIAEVNNIEFSNCGYGIHSNSSNTLSVQNCEFSSFNYPYLSKRGIFIQEPNLSNLIIGNEFYGNSSNSFYAIHISNSTGFGLIQENVFQDFRYAIFADGSNGRTGLLCNTNNDNISTDFNIVGTIMNPLGSPSVPAGNLFSKNSIAEINYSSGLLEYYYANNDLRQDPEISTGVRKIQTSSPLGCNPPVWNPDLPGIEEEYNDSYTIWNNYKSQLNSLIDGGDPSAIEFLILSASSLSSNDILVELSQHSPYLSANSLALLLSRTDVFSSSEIISILVLNPDVLKEEEFWLDLTSGNFPITSDNLEDLENARHLKTERTDLLAEINMSYSKVMQIVTEGIIFAVNDENSDNFDVRFWSKRLNAFESEINVAYSLFMDGEFDLLNDQIESLKVPGILSSEELSNLIQFEFFLNTLINHKIEGGNLMNLNQSDLQLINNIAIDDFKYVSPLCKTFLELFYGYEFDDSPPSEFKNFSLSNLLNTDKVVSEITIFPNPSEGTIYFNAENISLQLGDIDLQIIDLTGKLVSITSVSINQPIQLDKLSKGIYFYKLTNEHTILTKGKLVIR